MNNESRNIKGPIEYIKESWNIYFKKENFIFFAKIMAVLALTSTAIGFVSGYFYPSDYINNIDYSNIPMLAGFIIISILSIIAGLWSQTSIYISILKIGDDEKEVLKLGFKKMGKFLLISLTLGIIITFGALLLVIPAIIFGVWYSFSTFLVLDKELGVIESLKTSKNMVKGKFWKILGRSIVFGIFTFLVSIVVSLVPYAGNLLLSFIAPLFTIPFYLLYKDLSLEN